MILFLLLATAQAEIPQPATQTQTQEKAKLKLVPPLNRPMTMTKILRHDIGDTYIMLTSTYEVMFKPTSDKNIFGYDISVKLCALETMGDEDSSLLISNINPVSYTHLTLPTICSV